MKMWVSDAAKAHYRALAEEGATLLLAGRKAWRKVDPLAPVPSWTRVVDEVFFPIVAAQQQRVATLSASYSAEVLADQDFWVAPSGFVDPRGFAGVNVEGGNLRTQLLSPAYGVETSVAAGMKPQVALSKRENELFRLLVSSLAATATGAAGVDIAAREGIGYVRLAHPSACDRCIILAGKFYRWNQGFKRHPNCRCEHQATTQPRSGDMLDDPYELFNSLSVEEQDRRWGKDGAAAIREGADIYQVTNARRGMTKTRMFTTEGTVRGYSAGLLKPGQRRLTPEAIYKQAGGSRVKARELLTEHGYLLPGGMQVPGGSLRGRVEGFGQLGKGGKAKTASEAVLDARRTGVRDPRNRYTMTAAERRLYDAETRYRMVLEGKNPFTSPGFGKDKTGGALETPLTPQIAAIAEKDYRRWLLSGGEKYL